VIDFHAHILPQVDDGSKSVDESLCMLKSLAEQNVKTVVATPHFYANDESVDEFLARRQKSYEILMQKASGPPNIILGAEVRYYDGISHLQDLKKLRIEGTRFLLLEMPFTKWTEYEVKEVIDIAGRGKITLVLAHIERYLSFVNSDLLERLTRNGVLFQTNANFFDGVFKLPKAIRMLKNNQIHFIGTDCHNSSGRAPNMYKAIQALKKRIGEDAFEDYLSYVNDLFKQNYINQ